MCSLKRRVKRVKVNALQSCQEILGWYLQHDPSQFKGTTLLIRTRTHSSQENRHSLPRYLPLCFVKHISCSDQMVVCDGRKLEYGLVNTLVVTTMAEYIFLLDSMLRTDLCGDYHPP